MRLFVAVTPPREVREFLANTRTDVERARWVKAEQLHVTLRFLGEQNESTADSLREALRAIEAPAMTLAIKGIGTFGRPPRVLWCGLEPTEEICSLARAIEEAVVALGLPEADHPFAPHLTLARFKHSPPAQVRAYVKKNEQLESAPFSVDEFTLYLSKLNDQGAQHSPLETYPLAART